MKRVILTVLTLLLLVAPSYGKMVADSFYWKAPHELVCNPHALAVDFDGNYIFYMHDCKFIKKSHPYASSLRPNVVYRIKTRSYSQDRIALVFSTAMQENEKVIFFVRSEDLATFIKNYFLTEITIETMFTRGRIK